MQDENLNASEYEVTRMGKFTFTKMPAYIKFTEEERKIFGIGKKQPERVISPVQAMWDKRCAEFDELPNCQIICDKMKVLILEGTDDTEAIHHINLEFGVELDFLEYFYPMAKKSVLDKKEVGLI